MIWLFLAIITIAVIAALLLPLFRHGQRPDARQQSEIAIYRDQLAELEREVAAGLVAAEAAAATNLEIERKILASGDSTDTAPSQQPTSVASARMAAVILVASLAPIAAFAIYLATGSPGEPAHPYSAEADRDTTDAMTAAEMTALVEKLAAHLQQAPNNVEGWKLLGRSYGALDRPSDAANAYARALDLTPTDMELAADFAEALAHAAAGGVIPEKARDLFAQANRADPAAPKPRYYLALAKGQAGQVLEALAMLKSLEIDSPADAPWLPSVRARIEAIAKTAGIDPVSVAAESVARIAAPEGPSEED